VISLSVAGGLDESNPGFNILKPEILVGAVYALLYGDLIMQTLYRVRPYEVEPGSADALYHECMADAKKVITTSMAPKDFYGLCQRTIDAFDGLPLENDRSKPRVGVVGEILVKFHPTANNQVVRVIESEGCEANVPGLVDFFLFGTSNAINTHREIGSKKSSMLSLPGHQGHRGLPRAHQQDAPGKRSLRALPAHPGPCRKGRADSVAVQHHG